VASMATKEAILQAQARLNQRVLSLIWPALALYLAAVLSLFLIAVTPPAVADSLGSMVVAAGLGLAFWWRLHFQPLLSRKPRRPVHAALAFARNR